MKSGIYIIQNNINSKRYIGSAKDFTLRWRSHRNCLNKNKHYNKHLQQAWNKYGEKNFEFLKIALCPPEYLIKMEQWFLDNLKPEYNICKVAGNTLGVPMQPHVKEAIRKGKENYKMTAETRIRMRQAQLGRKMSQQSVEKAISTKFERYGEVMSKESRLKCNQKISESKKGKTWEELYGKELAALLKIEASIRQKGKIVSEDTKEKLRKVSQAYKNQIKNKSYVEIYGIEKSELIKQKISKASQQRKIEISERCKKTFTGIKQSEEHINKRINKRKIKIILIDIVEQTEVLFSSIKELSEYTKITFGTIKSALLSGKIVRKRYKFTRPI